MLIIGVDTGGTFTDFTWKDGDGWGEYKLLSTPENPAEAVLAGVRRIAGDRGYDLVHGSTVATNAILEKKGARTALITNRKFEDVIEIARQNRSRLYDFNYHKNPPLVPRDLRFGVSGRVDYAGNIIEDLDLKDVEVLLGQLRSSEVESIAVCLLFSFQNHEHECAVRDVLHELGIPVSLSHETLAEFREYERTSTTVINAYVLPKMQQYVSTLKTSVGENRIRIMQSNGGSISAQTAMQESVRTILSGPAGGAVGAFELAKMAGFSKVITFDMGGTSTDVALLDEELPLTMESSIADYPVKVPMIDIHTVGAGGGSIASLDSGGSLKVGPESAGADPGPICYGRGEQVTVTDANLFLGRLVADHFLGGGMSLDAEKVNGHIHSLAAKSGLSANELAEGILSVANTRMERAIKVISVECGHDPREFTLFAFGGAGGLHAAFLARELNIPQVFIPGKPGILSAFGMLMADVIKDYSQTVMLPENETSLNVLESHFRPIEERGRDDLIAEGLPDSKVHLRRYLDVRYQGQSYELLVPYGEDYRDRFHRVHEKTYGYCNQDKEIEVVNVRVRAIGTPEKPNVARLPSAGEKIAADAVIDVRPVVFDGISKQTKIIDRKILQHGNRVSGPAIIVEYSSTIVVPPFAEVRIDAYGNILMDIEGQEGTS